MKKRHLLNATVALILTGVGIVNAPVFAGQQLKIGVTAGLHAETLQQVIPFAKQRGLDIKIYEFQDYIRPNAALADGDLDANIFQTKPFLDAACRDRGYKLVPVGKTLTFPMAFYSKKISNLKDLKVGARVGIPNDPSQGGRALILLSNAGLIKLKNNKNLLSSVIDIIENKKNLKFIELEAAQLPHALSDLEVAAINGNYANSAGLNPSKDGLLIEDGRSPYVNYIVVREEDRNKPWVKPLVEAYQQPQVSEFIKKKYEGAVIPAF
ncbi:MAG: MetQ/NlpA family ABC transporter substrate-binding protein [Burkholderiaceae bacterium]|nr:MetQ/NlpA family ABC transporter substrate-binding protein [Burkholderiaceae bacterium]